MLKVLKQKLTLKLGCSIFRVFLTFLFSTSCLINQPSFRLVINRRSDMTRIVLDSIHTFNYFSHIFTRVNLWRATFPLKFETVGSHELQGSLFLTVDRRRLFGCAYLQYLQTKCVVHTGTFLIDKWFILTIGEPSRCTSRLS